MKMCLKELVSTLAPREPNLGPPGLGALECVLSSYNVKYKSKNHFGNSGSWDCTGEAEQFLSVGIQFVLEVEHHVARSQKYVSWNAK